MGLFFPQTGPSVFDVGWGTLAWLCGAGSGCLEGIEDVDEGAVISCRVGEAAPAGPSDLLCARGGLQEAAGSWGKNQGTGENTEVNAQNPTGISGFFLPQLPLTPSIGWVLKN